MKKTWPKKLLTAALTSSMMVSMCAVNLFAVTGDQVAKDKVYVGTGSVEADPNSVWSGYDITLQMEVKGGVIKSVTCTPAANMDKMNKGYVDLTRMQLASLIGKPATAKSVNELVDTNTGATYSLKSAKKIAAKIMQNAEAADASGSNPGTNPGTNPGGSTNPGGNTGTTTPSLDGIGDNDYIYGKLDVPYADFYYGELKELHSGTQTMDLSAADKASGMRDAGRYDAVTSATKNKAKRFPTTYYEETSKTVEILGIKDTSVAIRKGLYLEAMQAIKDGKTSNNPLLEMVKKFRLNENPGQATPEYKILNGDGTLNATTTQKILDQAARVEVETGSPWGNYLVNVQSEKIPSSDDIEGIIVKTRDGKQYGMEHLENIWLRANEFSFAVKPGFVEPHGNTVDYKRHEGLQGATITQIRYLIRNKADLVINTNVLCKTLLSEGQGATVNDDQFKDGVVVKPVLKTPAGSNYKLVSVKKGRTTLDKDIDYTVEGNNIVIKDTGKTGIGRYSVTYSDDKYEDINASFILRSKYKDGEVKLVDNKLTLPEGLSREAYADSIGNILIDGKRVRANNLMKDLFNEDGSVNFALKLKGRDGKETPLFTKGAAGVYTIELVSQGYPSVKSMVIAPGTKEVTAYAADSEHAVKMSFLGYKLNGYNLNGYEYEAYDISYRDATDNAVEPAAGQKVKVRIELRKGEPSKLEIFHDKGNKVLEKIKDYKVIDGKKIEFETDKFSTFIFANRTGSSVTPNNGNNSGGTAAVDSGKSNVKKTRLIKRSGIVRTGDSSAIIAYAFSMAAAVLLVIVVVIARRRKSVR